MKIWKWTLVVTDRQTVDIPTEARLLTVQMQGDHPQLWALVNETWPKEPRLIAIYGTGNPVPDEPGKYIATFQTHEGRFAWHVFDLTDLE